MATPAPPPITPLQWTGLDTTFALRAEKLTRDVMKGVTSKKLGSAYKGWRKDAAFKTLLVETGVKAGVSVAQGFAIGAIAAAGVAASAVTFGIAPAIGLVVGIGVSKTLDEYHYQSASNALRRDIKASASRNAMPLERLPEATMKVVKKYIRVARRGKMLLGGARGIAYNLRHLHTTVRSRMSSPATADQLSTKFRDDGELNRRLLEFRYYGQMTYNTVLTRLVEIVGLRNTLAAHAEKIYAHILRQVHFSGNHEHCIRTCYNISDTDFRANVHNLRLITQRGNAATSWYHARTDASAVRSRAVAAHRQQPMQAYETQAAVPHRAMTTDHFRHKVEALPAHLQPPAEEGGAWDEVKEHAQDFITDTWGPSVLGDMATAAADSGGGGFSGYQSSIAGNQASGVTYTSFHSTASTSSVPFGATVGAGVGTAGDLVLGALKERYSRRTIRKKVLGAKVAVENLMQSADDLAFHDLKEATDKLKKEDMGRISQKILWYGKKINELEIDPAFKRLRDELVASANFNDSRFADCKEACNIWYGVKYLLQQYGKMLANLVCMEMLLLKLDEKLVHLDIGVTAGSLIKEGAPTPARPAHMKDIK